MFMGRTDNFIIEDASSALTKQKDGYNEHNFYSGNVCKIGMGLEDPKARKLSVCSPGTCDEKKFILCCALFQFLGAFLNIKT